MDYLLQRPSGYYFRLMVPSDLKELFGISEIRRSLKTGSLCLAKERAFLLSGRLKKLFRRLRGQHKVKLKKEQIDGLIRDYIKEALEEDENQRLTSGPIESTEHHEEIIQGFDWFDTELKESLILNNFHKIETMIDNRMLKQNNLEADKDSYEYKKLCRETTKALVSVAQIQKKRERGEYPTIDYDTLLSSTEQSSEVSVAEEKSEGPSIKNLVDKWFQENIRADLWKPRTHKQYTGHFRVLLQILGEDTPIDSIDHSSVRNIKESLLKLPTGMNKKKIFQGKAIQEIIEITKEENIETLHVNTINSYLITLGAFFKWCVGNGHMTVNYAEGVKIKVSKQRRPDEIRKAFSTEHLHQIFNAPEYTDDTFKESYHFWLPILGLFTGARINELCQLRLDDIKEVDGIPSLILQEDSQDKEVSIKNAASARIVPLHPFITDELNFMAHIQKLKDKGEIRLFPELPYQNFNYGHKATKWFGKFKIKCGLESKQLVFHSFRHTLSDNLKQQLITETLIDELTGHAIQGETMGRYGKRYTPKVLYEEAVLKLDYKIDLDHLTKSKWVE